MNAINLSGHLTHDPELVHRGNRPVCEMRLAVDNGRYPTTYIDVRTFDGQAYVCAEYMRKGSKVAVSGRLAYNEWRTPDDVKRYRYSVIGHVEFLDRPSSQGDGEETPPPTAPRPEPDYEAELAELDPELAMALAA